MFEVIVGMLERLEGACAVIEELLEALLAAKEQNERLRLGVRCTQERADKLNDALWRLVGASTQPARVWHLLLEENADEIDALIRQGERIQAVKWVKELTGLGLKRCRDLVDLRAGYLRWQ
jgi:hypothetical protein